MTFVDEETSGERSVVIKKAQKKKAPCLICGHLSAESICLACQARIQGEAIEKKQEKEKKGRPDGGRR